MGLSFFNARLTVIRETPAARATSRIVTNVEDFEEEELSMAGVL
jgi:hypothetical protein